MHTNLLRLSFLVGIALGFSVDSFGQLLYGLKGGPSYSHLKVVTKGNDSFILTFDPKAPVIGYNFEFVAGGQIFESLEFRSGINMSLKGENESNTDNWQQPDIRLQYVGIPFYASWQAYKGWSIRAGGHFDFALGRFAPFFLGTNSGLDFAGVLGTGFRFGERVELEFRYLHGFMDVYRNEVISFDGRLISKSAWRNRSLQINLGVIFKK